MMIEMNNTLNTPTCILHFLATAALLLLCVAQQQQRISESGNKSVHNNDISNNKISKYIRV